MRNGLSAGPLPAALNLPYAADIERACEQAPTFSPIVAYAIKINETGYDDPPTIVSDDGGHGLFQLTSSFPSDWQEPYSNAYYACQHFLIPAETYWSGLGYQGDDLVRCIAAEFNAGRGGAMRGHDAGDVDEFTTNHYADRALTNYTALLNGQRP
jgi:hypothetical protein